MKSFDELVGRILCRVESDNDELRLYLTDTNYVRFYHEQDCCEAVYIESIVGDLEDLVGSEILMAEDSENLFDQIKNFGKEEDESDESFTWTFYKFATRKGYVDVRWYGTSNGYYSEGVSVEFVDTNSTE